MSPAQGGFRLFPDSQVTPAATDQHQVERRAGEGTMHTWKRPAPSAHLASLTGVLLWSRLASAGRRLTSAAWHRLMTAMIMLAGWATAGRHTDRLTGLADGARFRAASERSLARGDRHTAVLMIGLNELTPINDTLGRAAGDQVLIAFAAWLRGSVPAPGLSARLGEDRFAVVLTGLAHPADAYEIAGRIAAATAPIVVAGRLVTPAAGIGVAVSAPGELTHDQIVHRAELAMHRAQRNGPQTRWAAWQDSPETDDHHLAA